MDPLTAVAVWTASLTGIARISPCCYVGRLRSKRPLLR